MHSAINSVQHLIAATRLSALACRTGYVRRSHWLAAALLIILGVGPVALAAEKTRDPDLTHLQPTIDLPYLANVEIDGNADDWGEAGYKVLAMVDDEGHPSEPGDFSSRFTLAWDDDGILVIGHVTDDKWFEHPEAELIWQKDCLELFLAEAPGSQNYFQTLIAPGMADDQPEPRAVALFRGDPEHKLQLLPPEVAIVRNGQGYTVEARMPFANIGLFPEQGDTLGFQLFFDDSDHADLDKIYPRNVVWFPGTLTYLSSLRMHRVRLAQDASPPVRVAASGFKVTEMGQTITALVATPLPGETIEIRTDGKVFAQAPAPTGDGLQVVTMELTGDLGEDPMQWMTITSGGEEVGHFLSANEFPTIRGIARAKVEGPVATEMETRIHDAIVWVESSWPQRIMNYEHTPTIGITVLVVTFVAFTAFWVYRSRRLTIDDI